MEFFFFYIKKVHYKILIYMRILEISILNIYNKIAHIILIKNRLEVIILIMS